MAHVDGSSASSAPYLALAVSDGSGRQKSMDSASAGGIIGDALQKQNKMWTWTVFGKEHEHREQADVLEFVLRRLDAAQQKMSSASTGVHVQLAELGTLVRELRAIQVPEFLDVVSAFVSEIYTITELGEKPDAEVLMEFFGTLISTRKIVLRTLKDAKIVPEGTKDGKKVTMGTLGMAHLTAKKKGDTIEEGLRSNCGLEMGVAAEVVKEGKHHAAGALKKLHDDFKKYPVLAWIAGILDQKLREGDLVFLCAEWDIENFFPRFDDKAKTVSLPWACVGAITMEAIEDSALTDKDCLCFIGENAVPFRRGVRKIHSDILPHFQLRLTQLKAKLDTQVAKSETTKARMLAGFVTLWLSLLQIVFHHIVHTEASNPVPWGIWAKMHNSTLF